MKRYLIEEAKCGVTKGGMACGPVPGDVIVTIKYNDGTGSKWLNMSEVMGIAIVTLLEKDYHDVLMTDAFDDEFVAYLDDHTISEFDGIELGEDCRVIIGNVYENSDNPAAPLLKYLISLTRCAMDEVDDLIKMATGKYADELDIPMSDVEKDMLEDMEEYEE